MLTDSPVHPVLLATDLDAAREFYHTKLGLPIVADRGEIGIEFGCGDGTKLIITTSTTGTAETQTKIRWTVADLEATLAELRSRDVKIEEYDSPELKTEDGVADFGFARIAWIVDPGGNALAIMQVRT